jgi:RHS repeat-associated protein
VGYVIEDPANGAAGYLLSGGLAGGSETGGFIQIFQDLLGSEPWLEGSFLGLLFRALLRSLGTGDSTDRGGDGGEGTNHGDPVNLATGNLWRTETDLVIRSRGLPVIWSRTYNSRSDYLSPLGHGWTFTYGERLQENPDGSVLLREEDGTEHVFPPDGAGGYARPPGKHLGLTKDASGFDVRTKSGVVSRFDTSGRLISISEPNGNTVSLSYDAAGNLETVTDSAGRTVLTITTESGLISAVTDLLGRVIAYDYTGTDLTSVTDPLGQTWSFSYDEDHNLVARTDPLGNTDTYAYDSFDRCLQHLDPLGNRETFAYPSRGRWAVVTDWRGFDVAYEFDDRGRNLTWVDPLGNASRFTWDNDNNRVASSDSRGGLTSRTYDPDGNLLTETDALGNTTVRSYEPLYHQVATRTDADGHTVTFSYDARGNLIEKNQTVSGEPVRETYTYDLFGQLVQERNPRGFATTYVWDETTGGLQQRTDPLNQTTTYTSDAVGRITSVLDPAGNLVSAAWDARDRLDSLVDPDGNTTTFTYDEAGRQVALTNPRGTTTAAYDAAGRRILRTDALGNAQRAEYDPAGNLVAWVDARGNRTTTAYDAVGRTVAMVDPLNGVWSYGYCAGLGSRAGADCGSAGCAAAGPAIGSVCDLTDPLGNTAFREFDALGRTERIIDPLGNVTEVSYDSVGRRVAMEDALGRSTEYTYDEAGRLTAVLEASGALTEYSYDLNGNLTTVRDALGHEWSRTYDALDRVSAVSDPLGNTVSYGYDAAGNVISKNTPSGDLISYEYDGRKLTAIVLPGNEEETFLYDGLGRRVGMLNAESSVGYTYDALNRITEVIDNLLGVTISYGYDESGNRIRMTGPLGTVQYSYDAKGRLVEQRDPASGIFRFEYDSADRRSSLAYPNGFTTSYEYDATSRIVSVVTRTPAGEIADGYSHVYDAVGNRLSMRSLRDSTEHAYTYDQMNRLSSWQVGGSRFETYLYDAVGNRVSLSDEEGTVSYGYDAANRLVSELRTFAGGGSSATTYGWDANGRLSEKTVDAQAPTILTWDALDRLTEISEGSSVTAYGYNPLGTRVRESRAGSTERLLHSGEDIVGAYDDSGQLSVYYSHGPWVDEALGQVDAGGNVFFYKDALGSTTARADSVGGNLSHLSYGPFGGLEAGSASVTRFGFTGREHDHSGLLYFRARYLDPDTGRFLSRDPLWGDRWSPASLNPYIYAHENPTRFVDPFGTAIALPVLVLALLVTLVVLIALLAEPPAARQARVEATQDLLDELAEDIRGAYESLLGRVKLLFATTTATTVIYMSEAEGDNVIPFPLDRVRPAEKPGWFDPCWERFKQSEAWIYHNVPSDTQAFHLLMLAKSLLYRCRAGEFVVFPGEGPTPVP